MIGQIISHYKIVEKLGEGGMGVVYKAQDTKLDRFVALKFLPDHVSVGSNELERFITEAKAAASLNHPNICTIYGIEEANEKHFIVMEFVDGQTLQEKKSVLSQKQALDIGIQIADGLAAAHEKGIVHRDIKPENIMIRKDGIVQVMDFGLAKLRGASRLTKEGSTVGTAGYMSPEQVQGQDTDHRSDIFSLGVLLYEMFTGQIPFKGVHETAIAYEIVNVDSPPMSSVKPDITPELDAIILECLEKDPKERTQSASQVALDLKRSRRESSRSRASRITAARPNLSSSRQNISAMNSEQSFDTADATQRKFPFVITTVIALVMLASGFGISRLIVAPNAVIENPVISAAINISSGIHYNDGLGGHSAISPNGQLIVFSGTDSLSRTGLWIRPLNSNETKQLGGTEKAQYPFWSFDGRSIGFFADGKLKTIDAKGGPVMTITDAPFGRGGAWGKSGEIVYSPNVTDINLLSVSSSGGTPRPVTSFDSTFKGHPRFPFFLPDGEHFLFSVIPLSDRKKSEIYVGSVKTAETKKILDEGFYGMFASGYLFSFRQGILIAQPFDQTTLSLTGKPVSIQGNINSWTPRAKADFSVSETGLLLYSLAGTARSSELFWIDKESNTTLIGQFEPFTHMETSPDNSKIAYDQIDSKGEQPVVWIYDMASKVRTRLTFGQYGGSHPIWSSDGSKVFFNADVNGSKANIFVKNSDGSGEDQLLISGSDKTVAFITRHVSPDRRYLLISVGNESGSELAVLDLQSTQKPLTVDKLGIDGNEGRFSPDGKWIVFQTIESGVSKIYVSSFKGIAGKWQLPSDGGAVPFWVKGRIMYYSTSHDTYEACDVTFANGSPVFDQPVSLFTTGGSQNAYLYGISKDGNKYLSFRPANSGVGSNLSLIVNWKGLLDLK